MSKRLVLFDIDGTILLSGGAGRRAVLRALAEEASFEPDDLADVRFDGKTDPQIVRELLLAIGVDEARIAERIEPVLERYLAHLQDDLAINGHRSVQMPGITPLLDALADDGRVVVGLLTGNISKGASLKLQAARVGEHYFRLGAYGSDHHDRRALPAVAIERASRWFEGPIRGRDVIIIGDTPADVTCGNGVGARSIGVATGSYSIADLERAGADQVFGDLSNTASVRSAILDF